MSMNVGSKLPSPVRGQQAPLATTVGNKQAAEVVAETKLQQVSLQDVDAFLKARAGQTTTAKPTGLLASLQNLLAPKPPAEPPSAKAQEIQKSVQEALSGLTAVYADGLVSEAEIAALGKATGRMAAVLQLADPAVLALLPKDVRERLETQLFDPLQVLNGAARRRTGRVMDEVAGRDHAALQEKLQQPPDYRSFAPGDLKGSNTPSSAQRYAVGDHVGVPRSDGSLSTGVVTGHDPDGLRVEVLDASGNLGLKKLDAETLAAANPFKIGDVIDIQGGRVWVTGVGSTGGNSGKLEATVQDNSGIRKVGGGVKPNHPDFGFLEALHTSFVAAARPTVTTAVATSSSSSSMAVKPQAQIFVGGAETVKPETVQGKTASGAAFTYKGIDYKDYNEDAAVLGVTAGPGGKELVFAGAFDQAGGCGGVAGQTGAASAAAAARFQEAVKKIAGGGDAKTALEEAGHAAHDDINNFGVGAATTFAAGVIIDGHAVVMNCGDSGVLLVDKNGRVKAQTDGHNMGDLLAKQMGDPNGGLHVANVLTSCLGGNAQSTPQLDTYRWPVAKGDRLVFVSDGVLDSNLTAQKNDFRAGKPWKETASDVTARDIGRIVSQAQTPSAGAQGLIDYAADQVNGNKGKRDNVTAVVVTIA